MAPLDARELSNLGYRLDIGPIAQLMGPTVVHVKVAGLIQQYRTPTRPVLSSLTRRRYTPALKMEMVLCR
jgi:hypothetical protein